MCGIAGILDRSRSMRREPLSSAIQQMTRTLLHRGPDDGDTWCDAATGIALGQRRLSILDLTPDGRQPMRSASERFVIVFNGEIYNFQELRSELLSLGHTFRGSSDTEVMLASFEQWGIPSAVGRFVGMFAFAAWDQQERVLHLARDRMGEKPLYYGRAGGLFIFGSELKALRACPTWQGQISRGAVALYLNYGFVPTPHCIYEGVQKLPPGTILSIPASISNSGDNFEVLPTPYWSLRDVAERGVADPLTVSPDAAVEQLDSLLGAVVRGQMIADVPVGAFLSGGIDSSTIVALMQHQSSQRVKTFTVGFSETKFDEAPFAREVARHLGTDHTEMYVSAADALAVVPKLAWLYDEPLSDSSQIPTFLVSQLARQQVTVSLSGDGGDELFAGYNRYRLGERLWRWTHRLPYAARRLFGAALSLAPSRGLGKLSQILSSQSLEVMYERMMGTGEPGLTCRGARELLTVVRDRSQWAIVPDFMPRMQFLDAMSFLPDDILAKVDRAGMGVSLETRIPLLDHRCVEFAWRLPMSMKIREGRTKWVLRQVLSRYVPAELVDRKKMGFSIPVGAWLRGPLREWGEELLRPEIVRDACYVDERLVTRLWNEHVSGRQDWQYTLWRLLTLQSWLEEQKKTPAVSEHRLQRLPAA